MAAQTKSMPRTGPSSGVGPSLTKRYLSVKLRVPDEDQMQWALFTLTDSLGHLTNSEEIFFRVPNGQLKLRLAHPGKDIGELISARKCPLESVAALTKGKAPHFFEARTSPVSEAGQLRHTLNLSLEELAVMRKRRRTFTLGGSINFHLDSVDGLGPFLDIEIHPGLDPDEKVLAKAEELLGRLGVGQQALVAHSYLDLFLRGQEKREESDESAFSDESVP